MSMNFCYLLSVRSLVAVDLTGTADFGKTSGCLEELEATENEKKCMSILCNRH